jgi:tetratricopeptide (TPR) repeat protein
MRLAGSTVVVLGGLASLPRRLAARLLAERGARLARALTRGTGILVAGRRNQRPLASGHLAAALERADSLGIPVLGETGFLNLLGLTDRRPAPPESAMALAGRGVTRELARLLALFDFIDGAEELRARQALREVRRALGEGLSAERLLDELLHDPGSAMRAKLPFLTLAADEAGRLAQRVAGRIAELDGQFRLDLAAPPGPKTDALFEAAERAEAGGDFEEAERLYARCIAREPQDATLHFNLGNVLRELGRSAEAAAAFAKAAALDGELADAWFNLACLAEADGAVEEASRRYRRALSIEPDYGDALFNLARLETERENFPQALPLWQRYVALDRDSRWGEIARKGAALCRHAMMGEDGDRKPRVRASAGGRPRARSAATPPRPRRP